MSDSQDTELEQEEPDPAEVEIEQRARRMGWKPQDEFLARQGHPEQWLPARDYVERGETLLPLLQERNRAADKTITEMQRTIATQGNTLNELLARSRNAEQVGYRRAMQELNVKRHEAVAAGDTQAFAAVEQAMRELGPEPLAQAPPQQAPPQQMVPDPNPVLRAWVDRNMWFKTDPIANAAMVAAVVQEERMNPTGDAAEHLAAAEVHIRRAYPHHFRAPEPAQRPTGNGQYRDYSGERQQPPQRRPMHQDNYEEEEVQPPQRRPMQAAVSRSADSPPARRPAARSWDAMPDDSKREYERQKRLLAGKGDPLTKEEWAEYYFEQEPQ
jgi:hypothetical protein